MTAYTPEYVLQRTGYVIGESSAPRIHAISAPFVYDSKGYFIRKNITGDENLDILRLICDSLRNGSNNLNADKLLNIEIEQLLEAVIRVEYILRIKYDALTRTIYARFIAGVEEYYTFLISNNCVSIRLDRKSRETSSCEEYWIQDGNIMQVN